MVSKKDMGQGEAEEYVISLKTRVAKDNAIRWFVLNRGWYL
jgi:hypothetical protein